jgi:hypothetical protein
MLPKSIGVIGKFTSARTAAPGITLQFILPSSLFSRSFHSSVSKFSKLCKD